MTNSAGSEAAEVFDSPETFSELLLSVNSIPGVEDGLGLGMVLTVFVVSFYRLSGAGFIAAYTASSFTATILAFLLAGTGLLPVELPFLALTASLTGLGYMYVQGRR